MLLVAVCNFLTTDQHAITENNSVFVDLKVVNRTCGWRLLIDWLLLLLLIGLELVKTNKKIGKFQLTVKVKFL